jgi:hypothetical protein
MAASWPAAEVGRWVAAQQPRLRGAAALAARFESEDVTGRVLLSYRSAAGRDELAEDFGLPIG